MTGLFVYGAQAPGQPNEHIMTKIGGDGLPTIVLDKDGEPIAINKYVFT